MASKNLIKALCVVLSLFMIFNTSSTVFASTISEKREEIKKMNEENEQLEKDLEKLEGQVEDKQAYVNILMKKVDVLKDKLDALEESKAAIQSEIDQIEADIEQTVKEIDAAQKEIDAKEKEFEGIYYEYCQRLRAMYISGNVTTLEILLESGDIGSVLTRAEMVKCVSEQDSDTLDALMKKMQEIQDKKHQIEENKLALEENKKTLDTRKEELQASINDYSASKKELDAEVDECNAAIRSLDSSKSEIKETISANNKEKEELENAINEALSGSNANKPGNGNYNPGTGQLAYPTSYRTISAGYPNYSSGAYHGGVDWPCPTGTAVHAADSGVVVIAKRLTYSYGQYIVIDHGNGLSTLYAHNSSLCVSVGDKVSKGQLISYSGSTGNSTGPHLHFEVRLNGTRVNPMNYLG